MKESSVTAGQKISTGDVLGTAAPRVNVTALFPDLNPYAVYESDRMPVKMDDYWYFAPHWIIPKEGRRLEFKPYGSLQEAARVYFDRFLKEYEGFEGLGVLFDYDIDRVSVNFSLDNYPEPIEQNDTSVVEIEKDIYGGQMIYSDVTFLPESGIDGYKMKIYWQNNYSFNLERNEKKGRDIYVYGSFYAVDTLKKEIIYCINDYSYEAPKEFYELRVSQILED